MTDFRVVPQALRDQAEEVAETAGHYLTASGKLRERRMTDAILGSLCGTIPNLFNEVLDDVSGKLERGSTQIQQAADALRVCATHYEAVDQYYYQQFNYIDERAGN